MLVGVSVAMLAGTKVTASPTVRLLVGLGVFGAVFAVNSSVHSYLVLAYSGVDDVATNVGFYYMANAGGRLAGTLLSGVLYQAGGIGGCLVGTIAFAVVTAVVSTLLPATSTAMAAGGGDGGD